MLLLVILCGVLHREAGSSPWSDDRRIGDEPAWYQLGAPQWHAAVRGSSSIAETLTSVVDPLTAASHGGDTRAIAALFAAAAAGLVLVGLSRASVPLGIAALVALATIAPVLPVSAPVSITHALLTLTAVCLLLPPDMLTRSSRRSHSAMAALTIFGAAVHPAFIPFATGVWLVESLSTTRAQRLGVLLLSAAALGAGLLVAAMAMRASISTDGVTVATPDVFAFVRALVTGRFPLDLQPSATASLREAITVVPPVPLLLWTATAAVGLAVSHWGRMETRSAVAGVLVIVFASTTWVPDLAAAVAPATISILVLAARGLTWVWRQPWPGAHVLSLTAAAGIAAAGFVTPREPLRIQSAQMQAFVEAALPLAARFWSADRLATARALLQHEPDLTRRRRWIGDDMLRSTDASDGMVVFVEEELMTSAPRAVWFAPQALTYASAQSFFAAQPNTTWLALAVRGNAGGEFCRGVLDAVGVDAAQSATHGVALARLGRDFSSVSAREQLEIAFGGRVPALGQNAPARFLVDARDGPRVVINGITAAQAPEGLVLGLFDRWQNESRGFVLTDCADATLPAIADRRLRAGHVVERHENRALPAVPVLASSAVEVSFTESGTPWFGPGWHGVEAEPMRWTSAREAQVHVVSARAQAVRVRLRATLAAPAANELSIVWNGAPIQSARPFSGEGEWLVPEALVRRGLNTLTILVEDLFSPAATGRSKDTRLLGAAVSHLSFAPIPGATTPGPSTAPR